MSYGTSLKEARLAKGLTQEQLAEKITERGHKVTGGNVSNIERESDRDKEGNPVRPGKLFVIYAAEILDQDVDQMLMLADYAPNNRNLLPKEFEEFPFATFSRTLLGDIADYIRFKLSQNFIKINVDTEQTQSTIYKTEAPVVGGLGDARQVDVERPAETNGKQTDS